MTDKPEVCYWHLWADAEGISRQRRHVIDQFELKPIQPQAVPQWQGKKTSGAMSTMVTVLPVGWIGEWHENPKPQWIVPLSGHWFVEAMDGSHVELGPGEFSFGGDQHCREVNGKRGHRSGTVGDKPAVLMIIQLDDAPKPAAPTGPG
jgi:hypothetical protein